ncbi:MAG: glucose-6-phosphate dehydrogenase [Candidatus Levyibacteriota bacterium]
MITTPFVLVIFGGTGDLATNKLIPALFSLYKQRQLPEDFSIIGFARRSLSQKEFAETFTRQSLDARWQEFVNKHLLYQQGTFEDEKGYLELIAVLGELDKKAGACITRIFYLATPPNNYQVILNALKNTRLSEGCGQGSNKWTRIAIEKPFGKDLETAKALDKELSNMFAEEQIFRVDHYLSKETVQNMLVFRFANNIFEPIWNKEFIDHVQITWAEKKGIEGRGGFFDGVGLLRDVGQNHLLQLLTAVVMEMPTSLDREGVRDARAAAMKSLRLFAPEDLQESVVRGQYEGYLTEEHVEPASMTETFIAMKAFVDSERFFGVPFYIRAGKGMQKNIVEVSVVFKQTCNLLFREIGCPDEGNILTFRIQPDEGIILRTIAKKIGSKLSLGNVDMHFFYEEEFDKTIGDAYEKILLDIFSGDQMLFNRSDELAYSWEFIQRILEGWDISKEKPDVYKKGTWGPDIARKLIEKDGRKWIIEEV